MYKKVLKVLLKFIDDFLLILGIAFLDVGAFKIFVPAGYITLGICFIAFAFFIAKKGG